MWAVHELTPSSSAGSRRREISPIDDDDDLTSWAARRADGRVHVVVIGRPRSGRLEVSGQLTRGPGGRLSRLWRTEETHDGVLVTSLSAAAGPIVLVRRPGAPAVATVVFYDPPWTHGTDLQLAGVDGSGYRGPRPATVRRLVTAAVRQVLPSHPARGEVVWSGSGSTGAAALVKVRLGSEAGLHLLVEDAGAPAGATGHQFLKPAVAGRLAELAAVTTSSVVITLPDGRRRRVPSLHGPPLRAPDLPALAGSAFTLVDPTGRVTVVDASV